MTPRPSGIPDVKPGVQWARALCPACGWYREAFGARQIDRLGRIAQHHCDDKGHPVKFEHVHPAEVTFE